MFLWQHGMLQVEQKFYFYLQVKCLRYTLCSVSYHGWSDFLNTLVSFGNVLLTVVSCHVGVFTLSGPFSQEHYLF